jgi:hypothetical protein
VAVTYSIEVRPSEGLIAEPISAVMRCSADANTSGVVTFDHRSLIVELEQANVPEPSVVFPNRHAIEDRGRLIRLSSMKGIEDLLAGEERVRIFDLLSLFPGALLNVGRFAITYRLEEAAPSVRPPPAEVELMAGPEAVPLLIGHLSAENSALRFRAAELLTRMTGQDFGYAADGSGDSRTQAVTRWWTWWQRDGVDLPWNFGSDGATFGPTPDPAPSTHRSRHLGGIAYPGGKV